MRPDQKTRLALLGRELFLATFNQPRGYRKRVCGNEEWGEECSATVVYMRSKSCRKMGHCEYDTDDGCTGCFVDVNLPPVILQTLHIRPGADSTRLSTLSVHLSLNAKLRRVSVDEARKFITDNWGVCSLGFDERCAIAEWVDSGDKTPEFFGTREIEKWSRMIKNRDAALLRLEESQ